jgi:hypothetical protein
MLPSLIAGATAVGGTVLDSISTNRQNRRSLEFSERMYDKQYRDNINFWNMQNEYNTPQAQMERLRSAGLNPNLIYGKGAGAANTADSIKTPDVKQAQFNKPDMSYLQNMGKSMIDTYFDTEIKRLQMDNLQADNSVKHAEAALKLSQGARTDFDLGFEQELRSISADARRESLRQLSTNTNYTLGKWEREELMNSANLKTAAIGILNMKKNMAKSDAQIGNIKQSTRNLEVDHMQKRYNIDSTYLQQEKLQEAILLAKKDNTLKQLDIELKRMGVPKTAPVWSQILGRYINDKLNSGKKLQRDGSWK